MYLMLQELLEQLRSIHNRAEADLNNAPEGSLDISHVRGYPQYRLKRAGYPLIYLGKSDRRLAQKLAQKSYAKMVELETRRQLKAVQRLSDAIKSYESLCPAISKIDSGTNALASKSSQLKIAHLGLSEIDAIYGSLPKAKQDLVVPYITPVLDFVSEWESHRIESSLLFGHGQRYQTERGDLVRSKSEVIIADKLFHAGIPYKYEQPFETAQGCLYPDFVVLRTCTREEILWEHFGIMDDVEYCNRCMKKLAMYASEGIFPGKGLITTFETSAEPLDIRQVDQLISLIREEYVVLS